MFFSEKFLLNLNRIMAIGVFSVFCQMADASSIMQIDTAIMEAFPDHTHKQRQLLTLDDIIIAKAQKNAGFELAFPQRQLLFYDIYKGKKWQGRAYFDRHIVRTKNEIVMVAIQSNSSIGLIHILKFDEPREYFPKSSFLAQFINKDKTLADNYKMDIDGISGATLTARSLTQAALRILLLHDILTTK